MPAFGAGVSGSNPDRTTTDSSDAANTAAAVRGMIKKVTGDVPPV